MREPQMRALCRGQLTSAYQTEPTGAQLVFKLEMQQNEFANQKKEPIIDLMWP